MTDLTPLFNGFLKQHEVAPTTRRPFSLESLDEFLQEAYKIKANIASLHADLRNIRQSYLSTAQPRKTLIRSAAPSDRQPQPLTDREREEIDAQMKQMLRALNASIRSLADAESVRHETATTLIAKRHGAGRLNLVGAWAAGGAPRSKAPEHAAAEDREAAVATHRESVLWLLRQRLQECVKAQQDMMEIRISREMEKNRSVLAKARGPGVAASAPTLASLVDAESGVGGAPGAKLAANQGLPPDEVFASSNPAEDLTPEQIQMFEQENKEMLKVYESTLDQVRTAQKSLIEISELQTQLVDNLATQSAHIDQLVADSLNTTDNVGGGNKQLKQATQKASPAKYTFFATCGLCAFLIVWDLVI